MTMTEELNYEIPPLSAPVEEPAPFGLKADGTPYKVDPNRYATRTGRPRKSSKTPGSPPRKSTPNARKPPPGPDHEKALMGLVQIGAGLMAMAGRMLKSKALIADGCATIVHGPPVVEAVVDMAADNRQISAILAHVSKVGPYSALLTAVIPWGLQIMVNHTGRKPPAAMKEAFGVMSPDDLIAKVSGQIPESSDDD